MIEINKQEFTSKLTKIFGANGLSSYLSMEINEKFYNLTVRMLEENEKYNLTAITDIDKIILNHYADCVAMAAKLKKGANIVDVGCGAGFPALVVGAFDTSLEVTALDSTKKKVDFVSICAKEANLFNVKGICARAEECGFREDFDIVLSRGVARLNVLSELCLPLVKLGGSFIAMKGSAGEE